ncbi:hypothetical protein VTI74DRAFT_6312 [Chaetomium olivicolor]
MAPGDVRPKSAVDRPRQNAAQRGLLDQGPGHRACSPKARAFHSIFGDDANIHEMVVWHVREPRYGQEAASATTTTGSSSNEKNNNSITTYEQDFEYSEKYAAYFQSFACGIGWQMATIYDGHRSWANTCKLAADPPGVKSYYDKYLEGSRGESSPQLPKTSGCPICKAIRH